MRKLIAAAALAALTLSTIAAGPADPVDPPDGFVASYQLVKGETVTHEGPSGTGGATLGAGDGGEFCGGFTGIEGHCDYILVEATATGKASFLFTANYFVADFDVAVHKSDAKGVIGEEVASSGNGPGPVDACTPGVVVCVSPTESAEWDAKKGTFYAIIVDYYAAGGGYSMDMALA